MILKRIFNRRNVLSLLAVVIGITGIFGIPQRYGFTDQQLLLGIISFVALETIVLNAAYLEEITKDIRYLVSRNGSVSVDNVLSPQNIGVDPDQC